MAIDTAVAKRVGRTPEAEARVRWVLRHAALNLEKASDATRKRVWDGLFAIQSRQSVRFAPHPRALAETLRELRMCIDALAHGRAYTLWLGESDAIHWVCRPPPRRPAGARHSAPVTREVIADSAYSGAMGRVVAMAFIDDLNAIGADRLRACPLETEGQPCGVVFLARRRQDYCTPRHAQAAAWQAYLARGGDVKRKLRRMG